MKKFIFTTTLAISLAIGTSASANTDIGDIAGTTPDQFLYTFDQFFEDLKLAITFDTEEEANLLIQYAEERLAEATLMTEEEKLKFITEAINSYASLLEDAEETVSVVLEDEEIDDVTKDELSNDLENITDIDEEVISNLDEEQQEELENKIDEAYLVANIVNGFDTETVMSLREQEFGYGEIVKIISLSEISGKSIEEITTLLNEKEIGDVMNEFGIKMAQVKEVTITKKISTIEESLATAREAGDEKAMKKLEKKLGLLSSKKGRIAAKYPESAEEDAEEDSLESEIPPATELEDGIDETETTNATTETVIEVAKSVSKTAESASVPKSAKEKATVSAKVGLEPANDAKVKADEKAKVAPEIANSEAKKATEVEMAKKAAEVQEQAKVAAEKAKKEQEQAEMAKKAAEKDRVANAKEKANEEAKKASDDKGNIGKDKGNGGK